MNKRKIVLAGGSGFLGRMLAREFAASGWEVIVLSRTARKGEDSVQEVWWDGKTPGPWTKTLEGARAVINLAGRSVNCRYHAANRKLIMDSRVDSTHVLGGVIASCVVPPPVWLNSSTATIYKHSFERPMDELTGEIGATPEAKDEFSIEVATAWERALEEAKTPRTRKVALRAAMVLGMAEGSVFRVLRRLARWGLGGHMGNGQQYVSWVHQKDFSRAVEWLICKEELSGPVNLAAPNPLTNGAMMRTLREACHVPFGLPAARWMLEIGAMLLRTETELIIKSRRVVPTRLLQSGFQFQFPEFERAAADLIERL